MSVATSTMPIIQKRVSPQIRAIRHFFKLLGKASPQIASRVAVRMFLTPTRRPYSSKAKAVLAKAEPLFIHHGSRRLQGYSWGDVNNPTVLLVHGWEANAGAMREFVPPLLAKGYHVIAFDAPAHGKSAGNHLTIYDYSGALQNIGEKFGPIDGIIAHSLGAAAASLLLGREAKLGVKKIVVLGMPANMLSVIQSWGEFIQLPAIVITQMQQRLIDRIGLPIDDQTLTRSIANIAVPALIIHDKNDSLIPYANALALQKQWPTAALAPTQGLDHLGILYSPETVQRSISFIAAP